MKIFKEILRFFENFLKIYRNIRENLGKNLENMDFQGVCGAGPREANEYITKKLVEKSMETDKILKIFMNF